jgi:hypothetical protein
VKALDERLGRAGIRLWRALLIVSGTTLLAHLIEIAIWAGERRAVPELAFNQLAATSRGEA